MSQRVGGLYERSIMSHSTCPLSRLHMPRTNGLPRIMGIYWSVCRLRRCDDLWVKALVGLLEDGNAGMVGTSRRAAACLSV
jgi:hypothetical protein